MHLYSFDVKKYFQFPHDNNNPVVIFTNNSSSIKVLTEMFWSTIWLCLTILIYIIRAEKLDDFQRYKRFVNVTGMSVIDKNQHSKEYPYIVGVKTFHTRYGEIRTTRCTGTMLSPRLLLTTSYCVQNPLQITVR